MKIALKTLVILLLLFNGTGAVFGGSQLVLHPDGSSIGLPLSLLQHALFSNYLVPGIVLFFANGVFSLFAVVAVLFKMRHYPVYIIAQGIILVIWLVVQAFIIRMIVPWQLILGAAGIVLIIAGLWLRHQHLTTPAPAHGHS